jgi:NADH-quinone oxidoreductase subunit J
MLLGVDKATDLEVGALKPQKWGALAFVLGGVGVGVVLIAVLTNPTTGARGVSGALDGTSDIRLLARSLFSDYVYAFELTSLLLVIAVIGAVVLARKPKAEELEQ